MGPSGSGKSVLLRHIIGLEAPDAGEILIERESINRGGDEQVSDGHGVPIRRPVQFADGR